MRMEEINAEKYDVDIEDVLIKLENRWGENSNYKYNLTAFTKKRINSHNIMMCCPYHNETKPSFGISTSYPYMFNCFSCGASGELISLVSYVFEIDYLKAYRKILQDFSIFKLFKEKQVDTVIVPTEEEILKYRKKRHSYMEFRGISNYTLLKYEIGYDTENYAITFPVRDLYGNPSFIVKRNVNNKFYHIPEYAPKSNVLYGLNYLYGKTDRVFIVEGPIDVLSCYEARLPSVGLIGRTLSKNHVKLLQLANIKEVILFLDNDKWGMKGNFDAYKLLSKTPIRVRAVKYPESRGVREQPSDPNDLLKRGMLGDIKIISYLEYLLLNKGDMNEKNI